MAEKEFFNSIRGGLSGSLIGGGFGIPGGIIDGGFYLRNNDKGYSSIGIAFIDKSLKKVLFYSKQPRRDDPLGDSTMIKQLEPMLIWL